jgi:hypothetical protein
MKTKWFHIFQLIKVGLGVLTVVTCLSGCNVDDREITGTESDVAAEDLTQKQRECWQADVLRMFYNVTAEASLKAYPAVTSGAFPFMMVAFAVWLSVRVLKHVSSVVEESPAEIWTEVGRMAVACLFCGLLASSTSMLLYALNTFIFPIYYTFLELGSRIVALTADETNANISGQPLGDECLVYTNSLICTAPALEKATASSFPKGPSQMMECLACSLSDRMQVGFIIANDLFSAKSLTSFVAGCFIYVIFTIVKISFVFYMIDSIFRLCMMVIILPFLILAVPFRATRKWSKLGLQVILNSSANMMCLAIIMTMTILAMQITLQENNEELGNKGMYMEFSLVMVSMLLMAFLVLKSCGLAVSMANSLVGGGGDTKFQEKIAKLAAFAGKSLVGLVSAGIGKAMIGVMERVKFLSKAKVAASKVSNAMSKLAGRDKSSEDL